MNIIAFLAIAAITFFVDDIIHDSLERESDKADLIRRSRSRKIRKKLF